MALGYWESEGYVVGADPLYGIRKEDIEMGYVWCEHKPTGVKYLFTSILLWPEPFTDWRIIGYYYTREIAEGIGGTPLDDALSDVGNVLGTVMGEVAKVSDSVTHLISSILTYIGKQINSVVDTGRPDEEAFFFFLTGLVASFVAGPYIASIPVISDLVSKVETQLKPIYDRLSNAYEAVENRIKRAKSVYANIAETIHLDRLHDIDTVLTFTVKEYRAKKLKFTQWIAELSGELFGDVNEINQYLALAKMLMRDNAALRGESWDEAERKNFNAVVKFFEGVEKDLGMYEESPHLLYAKIENELIYPHYEEKKSRLTALDTRILDVKTSLESAAKTLKAIDLRLSVYRVSLPEDVRKEIGPELLSFAKELRNVWEDGLEPVIATINTNLKGTISEVKRLEIQQRLLRLETGINSTILSDPNIASTAERIFQRQRITAIDAHISDIFLDFAIPITSSLVPIYGDKLKNLLGVD